MKITRIKNILALTALAFLAGSLEKASAFPVDHWTLTGVSPGGGYTIVGSGALDLGPLSPTTFPVHLSANGFDIITLNAGSTASSGGSYVIYMPTPGNTLNNYGSILGNSDEAVEAYGNNITINNYGNIYAADYAMDIEANNNVLTNKGLITSPYDTVYLNGSNDTINNLGSITATGTGGEWAIYTDSDTSHLTVNNFGTIIASGSYAYYDNEGSYNTINNLGTISGSYTAIYLDATTYDTINNWGTLAGPEYAVEIAGNNNVLNNRGIISGTNYTGVYFDGTSNIVNNWGTVYAADYSFLDYGTGNIVNNWGLVTSPYLGIYEDASNDVINNQGTVHGDSYAIYNDGFGLVINNLGVLSSNGSGDTIYSDGDNLTVNNWGAISQGPAGNAIYIDSDNNTVNLNGHSSVTGKMTLLGTGNVVNLNFTGLSPATITSLNALLKTQGVNSGLPTSSVQFTLRGVAYDIDPPPPGTFIVNSNLKSYQLQAQTPNQASIGRNLDSLLVNPVPGTPFFNLLNAIDQSGNVPGALDAISPLKYAVYGDLAIQNTTSMVQNIDSRLNNLRDGSESVDTTGLGGDNTVAAVVTGDPSKDGSKESKQVVQPEPQQNRWGFFATGDGLFFRGGSANALQDGKSNTAGTLAGVDGKVGEHAVIGAFFAYNNSAVDLGNDGSHATIESYSGGIYGSYHQDGFYANSLAAYTRNNYTSSSNVLFPGFATTGNGSTHGNQYSANIDGGYDFNLSSRLTVGPIAGLQYVHLDVDGFNEAGGALALGDQSLNSLQSRVGAKAQYKIATTATSSTGIEVYAAWQHEYLDNSRGINASFQGSGLAPFAVQTGSPERDAGVVGAAINFSFHNRLTLFADYELQMWNESNFSQSINGGAKISW